MEKSFLNISNVKESFIEQITASQFIVTNNPPAMKDHVNYIHGQNKVMMANIVDTFEKKV